jgi:2-(1,2-epoxy-1,2-dihydrophenyl)acetyl-CoA isomerase
MTGQYQDLTFTVDDDMVATVEIHRAPNNFFDIALIQSLADIYRAVDDDPACRAIVLCAEGKHFCAGADFSGQSDAQRVGTGQAGQLYVEAVRLFAAATPVVAAVQGGAIGGGLGLACSADFRVACPEARFAANFSRLGFHHGFGLSVTLPRIVGNQHALDMLYTGRRVPGTEAAAMGLCDRLVPLDQVRAEAHALAADIARSAPLAVRSIRETMRGDLAEQVRQATARENKEQDRLRRTEDWGEGVRASAERREPHFVGR